jgi:hypothetical protein
MPLKVSRYKITAKDIMCPYHDVKTLPLITQVGELYDILMQVQCSSLSISHAHIATNDSRWGSCTTFSCRCVPHLSLSRSLSLSLSCSMLGHSDRRHSILHTRPHTHARTTPHHTTPHTLSPFQVKHGAFPIVEQATAAEVKHGSGGGAGALGPDGVRYVKRMYIADVSSIVKMMATSNVGTRVMLGKGTMSTYHHIDPGGRYLIGR